MVWLQIAALCFLILIGIRASGKDGKSGVASQEKETEKEAYYRGYDEGFKAGFEKGCAESSGGGVVE